jgi:hypothetical protein
MPVKKFGCRRTTYNGFVKVRGGFQTLPLFHDAIAAHDPSASVVLDAAGAFAADRRCYLYREKHLTSSADRKGEASGGFAIYSSQSTFPDASPLPIGIGTNDVMGRPAQDRVLNCSGNWAGLRYNNVEHPSGFRQNKSLSICQ